MPQESPDPPLDFDPEKTLFFSRRKKGPNLLPIIVVGALVLGSGALVTWAFTSSKNKAAAAAAESAAVKADLEASRPIVSAEEAKAMENPAVSTPAPPGAKPTPAPFDPAKQVRAATAVTTPAAGAADPADAPPVVPDPNAPLNFSLDDPNNSAVRAEVLQRIDLMPGVSAGNKDKLYASVDHARKMGRVLTLPFDKGESEIRSGEIDKLKTQIQSPAIKQLLDDPTVVFVVLGYADPKGNDKINAEISQNRAKSVMKALQDDCGLQNVMHSVAMGGSTLFSKQQAEKNRVVEIWAVVP
jgi:outer membrane protein OmpA-like peptidoglycan-associated protein